MCAPFSPPPNAQKLGKHKDEGAHGDDQELDGRFGFPSAVRNVSVEIILVQQSIQANSDDDRPDQVFQSLTTGRGL